MGDEPPRARRATYSRQQQPRAPQQKESLSTLSADGSSCSSSTAPTGPAGGGKGRSTASPPSGTSSNVCHVGRNKKIRPFYLLFKIIIRVKLHMPDVHTHCNTSNTPPAFFFLCHTHSTCCCEKCATGASSRSNRQQVLSLLELVGPSPFSLSRLCFLVRPRINSILHDMLLNTWKLCRFFGTFGHFFFFPEKI